MLLLLCCCCFVVVDLVVLVVVLICISFGRLYSPASAFAWQPIDAALTKEDRFIIICGRQLLLLLLFSHLRFSRGVQLYTFTYPSSTHTINLLSATIYRTTRVTLFLFLLLVPVGAHRTLSPISIRRLSPNRSGRSSSLLLFTRDRLICLLLSLLHH